ncbi:MAG: hypothetical protein QM658_03215 [Gordonia sp. (in: high G+C Gram-positive bacteria)]
MSDGKYLIMVAAILAVAAISFARNGRRFRRHALLDAVTIGAVGLVISTSGAGILQSLLAWSPLGESVLSIGGGSLLEENAWSILAPVMAFAALLVTVACIGIAVHHLRRLRRGRRTSVIAPLVAMHFFTYLAVQAILQPQRIELQITALLALLIVMIAVPRRPWRQQEYVLAA